MKYLIIGAGGTGGLIAGYLARTGADVTLLARGQHLRVIQNDGLLIKTYGEKAFRVKNIKAVSEDELNNQEFNVIFICVKAYDLSSVVSILDGAANTQTIIIPVLNSLSAGSYLRSKLPHLNIFDGCIYITGYISEFGVVSQNNKIFKIFYGEDEHSDRLNILRERMESSVSNSGIEIQYSSRITSEIFRKLTFTSAFASSAAFYHQQASGLQEQGIYRQLFINLLAELQLISVVAQFDLEEDLIERNLVILDSLSADFTASLQKDLLQKKQDERNELIFDIVRLAEKHGVSTPNYSRIAEFFGYRQPSTFAERENC